MPISAGILPETMISAKLIVRTISVMISELIAMILHFVFALILFDPTATFGVGNLLLTYLAILVFTAFMVVVTISINAISKKGWLSAMLPIVFLIVGTTTLESILVGNTPMIAYTPFMFYELAINISLKLSLVHWLSASISMLVVIGGFVTWAILSSRVKPNTVD